MSKLQKIILKRFNSTGCRWIISFLYKVISILKNKTCIDFRYDKENKKWLQYYRGNCFFVDVKPNWNINPIWLEKNVSGTEFVQYKPGIGDVIIDIGAGVGTESVVYSQQVGSGKIYSIEAHPDTYNSLKLLVDTAKIQNIIPVNIAIADKSGTMYIENRENHVENSVRRADIHNGIKIKSQTLDEFVEINGIIKINFLKINIEGAEVIAIKGMENAIKITNYIAVSCHDFLFEKNTSEIKDIVTEFLIKNNFTLVSRATGHVAKDSWIFGKNKMVQN